MIMVIRGSVASADDARQTENKEKGQDVMACRGMSQSSLPVATITQLLPLLLSCRVVSFLLVTLWQISEWEA